MAPPGHGPQANEHRELRLRVPADPRYAELARLAVTGVAVRNGCNDATVQTLDSAFSEAFAALMASPDRHRGAKVTITADVHRDTVEFGLTRQPGEGSEPISLRAQR